jgi:hypothetical protein
MPERSEGVTSGYGDGQDWRYRLRPIRHSSSPYPCVCCCGMDSDEDGTSLERKGSDGGALTSGNRRSIDRVSIDVKMARSPVGMTFQCVTCAIVLVMSWSTCARDLENGKQTGPASRKLAPNRAVFLDSFDDIPGVYPVSADNRNHTHMTNTPPAFPAFVDIVSSCIGVEPSARCHHLIAGKVT